MTLESRITQALQRLYEQLGRYPAALSIPGRFYSRYWKMSEPLPPTLLESDLPVSVREHDIEIREIQGGVGAWAYQIDADTAPVLFWPEDL